MFGIDDMAAASIVSTALNVAGDLFSQSNAREAFQTRYQDTVRDMRKAGLNPALAYGQGGGSPQTMSFGDWGSSAASAAQAIAAAKKQQADTELTKQQTELLKAQTADLSLRPGLVNANLASLGHLFDNTAALRGFEKDFARDTYEARVTTAKTASEQARTALELSRLSIPERRAYAKYYQSPVGRAEPYLNSAKQISQEIRGYLPWSSTETTTEGGWRTNTGYQSHRETTRRGTR